MLAFGTGTTPATALVLDEGLLVGAPHLDLELDPAKERLVDEVA